MKRLCVCLFVLGASGCGPSYGGQDVKTPDQLVDEQEQIAAQDEKDKKAKGNDDLGSTEETDAEKKREFDQKQTKLELQRATISAESCPGVVAGTETKDHPRGDTRVTVTFQQDGTVKEVTIPSPFDGTPIGDCVLQAYKKVLVPPYDTGGDQIMDWDVSLKDAKGDKGKKGKKGKKDKATQAPASDDSSDPTK